MNRREKKLRAMWSAKGITKETQDKIIASITPAAQPGAMVGPFRIPDDPPARNRVVPISAETLAELVAAMESLIAAASHPVPGGVSAAKQRAAAKHRARLILYRVQPISS